jgi:transposase-like protein
MDFTQTQITEILDEIANKKEGYQNLLKMTLESIMRAERNEFNSRSNDSSNGYRRSSILAHGGKMSLVIPRSRHHNFYPLILALIRDQEAEYKQMAYELYIAGLTTEQVGSLFEKIYGKHYSKQAISNMVSYAKTDIEAWLNRPLQTTYPIVYIDATYWYTRRQEAVSSEAYYTVLGVREDRTREVLAIVNHPTEGAGNWQEVFQNLKTRGVKEIKLFVCDGLTGIENTIAEIFPRAQIQLCTVHLSRGLLAKIKPKDKAQIASEIKDVLNPANANDTQSEGHNRFVRFIEKWKKKYPSLASYQNPRYRLYFTYLNYHMEIRRMIYTTNWIERLNRNYKRTLRMRSSMPNPASVLFLLGSVASQRKEYNYPIYQFQYETKLFN